MIQPRSYRHFSNASTESDAVSGTDRFYLLEQILLELLEPNIYHRHTCFPRLILQGLPRVYNLFLWPQGKCYFGSCFCFTVKAGTTIFGVLEILAGIMSMSIVAMLANNNERHMDTPFMKQFREMVPVALNPATKTIYGIISMISVILAILLVRGNSQSKPKIMYPWVYWYYATLALSVGLKIIRVISSTPEVQALDIFTQLAAVIIAIVIGFFIVQVVRSRVTDIDRTNRPEAPAHMRPNCSCTCINWRFASISVGVITTIVWIVYSYHTTLTIFPIPIDEYGGRYTVAIAPYYAVFVCSLGNSALSTLMVFGAIKRIADSILPWLAVHFVATMFAIALSLCEIIIFILIGNKEYMMISMPVTILITTLLILSWTAVYLYYKSLVAQSQVQPTRPEDGKIFETPKEPTRYYQPA